MSFNGSGDNIIVANDSSLNPAEITIAFWTKINSYGLQGGAGYNHFVNKFVGNGNIQYVVANNFTGLYAYINSQQYVLQWHEGSLLSNNTPILAITLIHALLRH